MHEIVRSLRTAERFLLAPPLAASFGTAPVAICDLSARGARFRHESPLEMGAKAILRIAASTRLDLEAVIVWTRSDPGAPGKYLSGTRTYGPLDAIDELILQLRESNRTQRIEELRSTERFTVIPPLLATYDGQAAGIEDLSARGARITLASEPRRGASSPLSFQLPETGIEIRVSGQIVWTALKSIDGSSNQKFSAGLLIEEKPELLRLAIGHLGETNRAAIDPHSLVLKLRILRARARQMAPSFPEIEASGIPAEQFLLIQGVREELRLNPEEAMHWYRRARLLISDPATHTIAPVIATHPDALAVWEYLERSVDPSIVGRAFSL